MAFWEIFWNNLIHTSSFEWVGVLAGITYVILAARESIWCWPASLLGVTIYAYLCYEAKLYPEAALQVFYFAMAFYGWSLWSKYPKFDAKKPVVRWGWKKHVLVITGLIALAVTSGYILTLYTDAALPYLDSFTTISAVFTTYMVAQKILENWIYWIVIDLLSVYLYCQRDLALTSILYLFFAVIALYGYYQWFRSWKERKLYA